MADENATSTVADSATTPAAAESVETAQQIPSGPESAWDFSNVKDEPAPDAAKPAQDEPKAEPAKESEKTTDTDKTSKTDEVSDEEDQILAEAFGQKKADEKAEGEEESDPEEAIDKQNPDEMKAAQRNATAKSYLERAERVYTPAKDFKYGTIQAPEFAERLTGFIGEEKMQEFSQTQAHKLVDENPDAAFHRIYAVKMSAKDPSYKYDPSNVPTLDELISGQRTSETSSTSDASAETAAATEIPTDLASITKELDGVVDFDWRNPENDSRFVDELELAMVKTIRGLEQKALAESKSKSELTEKLSKLEKSVEQITTDSRTEGQKAVQKDLDTAVNGFRSSIETKILPYIAKNTGLEVSKDDTPEVAAFKERKLALYTGDEFERSQGLPSRFETFAYERSSVKQDLMNLAQQVVDAQLKAVVARRNNDAAKAKQHEAEVNELRIPTIQLLAKANDEFKAKYIDPDITLLGMKSAKVAQPILEAAERIETVAPGTAHSKPVKKNYSSAEDVWEGMVSESAEEERMRSAA
jgi:hypothetical protein